MPAPRTDPPCSVVELRSFLDYNHETGEFWWKHSSLRDSKWNSTHAGKPAGGRRDKYQDGRLRIGIKGRLVLASRIAWFHFYGKWPVVLVDHKNCDPSDDRINNVRLANSLQSS